MFWSREICAVCGFVGIDVMAEPYIRKRFQIKARDRTLDLGARTAVMGILNVTPDSFSDQGRYLALEAAVDRAWEIVRQGADILDIGGESTRPGSIGIEAEEELRRVLPVLEALGDRFPIPISIDTSKACVARAALERGVSIVNDVTSLQRDPEIGLEAAKYGAAVILMHMRGEPRNMQTIPASEDILADIDDWARLAVARARNSGIAADRIILDPGIGFGKTAAQNLEILRNLERLAAAEYPILVGTSRKSFIGSVLKKSTGELIWGTAATVAASIIFGAHIVRVHDVAEMLDVAEVTDAIVREDFIALKTKSRA